MREVFYAEAVREAILAEMESHSEVFVAGEDISWGGVAGQYAEFSDKFPGRIVDTPISETAIAGLGLGSAVMGLRPILDFTLIDFTLVAMDEICNQIAKFRYINGGNSKVPLVIYCSCGASESSAAQHSQSLEALFSHIPGLKVVFPSNPKDAKGLITSAMRDDDPVMFIQHLSLLGTKADVPDSDVAVPIGQAAITIPGEDVTIISYGNIMPQAAKAAKELEQDGFSAEVIDLRTLTPLDTDTIIASVKKTGRVVIAHEAVRQGGIGAEVAAIIAEEAFDSLSAPIKRLGAPFCPVPYSPALKDSYYVSAADIYAAAKDILQ